MNNHLVRIIFVCLFPFFTGLQAGTQEEMLKDLEIARHHLSIKYAPGEWKQELFGWSLDSTFETAKMQVFNDSPDTSKAYQRIFKKFLGSTRDYHVKSLFFSTEWSMFPLQVKGVDGRFYVTGSNLHLSFDPAEMMIEPDDIADIDRYDTEFEKIRIGDELLALDGVPIQNVIEQLIEEELGGDHTPTGYALAEKMLFLRRGKYGEKVPSGTFTITVQGQDDEPVSTATLPWIHFSEAVKEPHFQLAEQVSPIAKWMVQNRQVGSKPLINQISTLLAKDYTVRFAEDLVASKTMPLSQMKFSKAKEVNEDERNKGFLPELGKVLWETAKDKELYAYLYQNRAGNRIGYIHLHSFKGAEPELNEIIEVLKVFNENSAALVLDVTNNPGGSLFYMLGVLSTLTDKPLHTSTQREMLIQEDVYVAAMLNKVFKNELESTERKEDETIEGYPVNKNVIQELIGYTQHVMQTWESGQMMTAPYHPMGLSAIIPHPAVRYTKPILLLINELDFSCGDLFPAILQDNKRATLFGVKTAGAGGYVKQYAHTSRFGVNAFSLTGSILYRADGKPIENLGVTPDIPYEITERDLKENYAPYIRHVNKAVMGLIS